MMLLVGPSSRRRLRRRSRPRLCLSERRAQLDLQINLLAEQETTKTLQMLEAIARQVGAQAGEDPEVAALAEATRLDSLARQIDDTQRQEDADAP